MKRIFVLGAFLVTVVLAAPAGCGDDETGDADAADDDGRPEDTGAACAVPDDCYLGIERGAIKGTVTCMDRVRDGYCTHTCGADTDCCAAAGECEEGIKEVCSPFESEETKYCFLSCESGDLVPAPGQSGPVDEQEYCQRRAGKDFICRSSGGGGENRKVCVPGDCGVGADCGGDADCGTGLVCITNFQGGYCSIRGCATNADCPGNTFCVNNGADNYCYRTCSSDFDCSFCRASDYAAGCRDDVTFVESGTTGTVCVPPGG